MRVQIPISVRFSDARMRGSFVLGRYRVRVPRQCRIALLRCADKCRWREAGGAYNVKASDARGRHKSLRSRSRIGLLLTRIGFGDRPLGMSRAIDAPLIRP